MESKGKARIALLSNLKAILLASVIGWHLQRCGQAQHCMPGYLSEVLGTSQGLVNSFPKVLGSSTLSGLMLLAGSTHGEQSRRGTRFWTKLGLTALPGLLIQFVVAPAFDRLVPSTIPTNGHVWFLYSLAVAQLLLRAVDACGGGRSAVLAVSLTLSLLAAPLWAGTVAVVPSLSAAQYDGITVSAGEWFLPVGVRVFTYPVFFAIGAELCQIPVLLELHERTGASSTTRHVVWLVNAACWAYSMARLRLGSVNMFSSAPVDTWLLRVPRQLEMMVISGISPLALLAILPNRRIPLLTWAGEATLAPYLLHPCVLKLLRPQLAALVALPPAPGDVAFAVLLETVLVPLLLLVALSAFGRGLFHVIGRAQAQWPRFNATAVVVALTIVGACLPPPPAQRERESASAAASAARGGAKGANSSITLSNGLSVMPGLKPGEDVYLCQMHDTTRLFPHGGPTDWAIRSVIVDDQPAMAKSPISVHHVTAYFCSDDADAKGAVPALRESMATGAPFRCDKQPFMPRCDQMLFTFAPGDTSFRLPDHMALAFKGRLLAKVALRPFPRGRLVMLQVHYLVKPHASHKLLHPVKPDHPYAAVGGFSLEPVPAAFELLHLPDLLGAARRPSGAPEIAHFFEVGPRYPTMLQVPPQTARTLVTSYCAPSCLAAGMRRSPTRKMRIFAIRHHMHKLGVGMTTQVVSPTGYATTIWESTEWDPYKALPFHIFDPPIELREGEALRATCVYSSLGKGNATTLGSTLNDEMCFSYMLVTAIEDFSNCWHAREYRTDVTHTAGCYGICKGLGQSARFAGARMDLSNGGAVRFEIPGHPACAPDDSLNLSRSAN